MATAATEYLAGLVVAVLVCAVGINLVLESVTKIIKPSPTAYTLVSLAALATSMLVKLWMAAFNRTLGDRIDSETLIATARDSKTMSSPRAQSWWQRLFRRRPALTSMAGRAGRGHLHLHQRHGHGARRHQPTAGKKAAPDPSSSGKIPRQGSCRTPEF